MEDEELFIYICRHNDIELTWSLKKGEDHEKERCGS
jgi:hypothetical protein